MYLKHLKLHDLHLYRCPLCPFIHHLRHKVDKHCTDRHPDKNAHTATVRALDSATLDSNESTNTTQTSGVVSGDVGIKPANIGRPWHCGMCKYKCGTKDEILTHTENKHYINNQFKCTLCSFKSDGKDSFDEHFKQNHPDNDIDVIDVYYKIEQAVAKTGDSKQFDTTPLWQRDRPRVRHIRGILFEESNSPPSQKSGKKIATPKYQPSTSSSNLDLAIEAVAKGTDDVVINKSKNETSTENDVIDLELDGKETKKPTSVDVKLTKRPSGVDSVALMKKMREGDVIKMINEQIKEFTETTDRNETVIVIDDDDEIEESPLDETNENLTIDLEVVQGEKVKKENDETLLTEDELVKKHGRLCGPGGKAFKCPICSKFKSKKVSHFVYHMLKELKCYR